MTFFLGVTKGVSVVSYVHTYLHTHLRKKYLKTMRILSIRRNQAGSIFVHPIPSFLTPAPFFFSPFFSTYFIHFFKRTLTLHNLK